MDHDAIYAKRSDLYDLLVDHEDYLRNLPSSLRSLVTLAGKTVVESGAGTGRITRIIAGEAEHVFAFDRSSHMIETAERRLTGEGIVNVSYGTASHHSIPVPSGSADIVLSGWSVGYLSKGEEWENNIGLTLSEFFRICRKDGTVILIETLGTGTTEAGAPADYLDRYYRYIEHSGFSRTVISTKYRFPSLDTALEAVMPFFGDAVASKLQEMTGDDGSVILPEYTGIWMKQWTES